MSPGKTLAVPYINQLANQKNPYGSCNVSSIGMCLQFLGIRGNGSGRLADQMQRELESRGLSRHAADDLRYLVNEVYGPRLKPPIVDIFDEHATIEEIKGHIDKGFPAVIHGWFTQSGHIITIVGYNERGFVVNDPYGEWFPSGYVLNSEDTPARGKGLTYSYGLISRTCDDNGIFTHFISRG